MSKCEKCGSDLADGECVACDWKVVLSFRSTSFSPSAAEDAGTVWKRIAPSDAIDKISSLLAGAQLTSEDFVIYVGAGAFNANKEKFMALGKVHSAIGEKEHMIYVIEIGGRNDG